MKLSSCSNKDVKEIKSVFSIEIVIETLRDHEEMREQRGIVYVLKRIGPKMDP